MQLIRNYVFELPVIIHRYFNSTVIFETVMESLTDVVENVK